MLLEGIVRRNSPVKSDAMSDGVQPLQAHGLYGFQNDAGPNEIPFDVGKGVI